MPFHLVCLILGLTSPAFILIILSIVRVIIIPLFLTQYCLHPIRVGDVFLSAAQRSHLQGCHLRRRYPEPGKIYIAGIDLAGEQLEGEQLLALNPCQDSTVVTIAELDLSGDVSPFLKEPAPGLNQGD
jgi:hypothetical protein